MKKIDALDNEFLIQFRQQLRDSFPVALALEVDYYLGEDDNGKRGLYFTIVSRFGRIYTRIQMFSGGQLIYDVEEEFMNAVINDLILNGITFLNNLAFESISLDRVNTEVKAKLFRHNSPRRFLYIN